MAGRHFLFVPGPTNVPDRVTRAMMVAMEDHRSSKFPEFTLPLFQDLKKVFKSADGQNKLTVGFFSWFDNTAANSFIDQSV